ncbi:MAG TPA: glycosyltransferase family 4 protein [Candidatus Bathyarchaeia archaeon]|nr:glycosyltransferase family 4 protein [Candidatus Bathyarchaeia archaeon]
MKILIGCEVFYPYLLGGGEIFAYNISRQLAKLGHEVHVICPTRSFDRSNISSPLSSMVDGVRVHRVSGEFRYRHGIQSLPYVLRMYHTASDVIREFGIEIANAQTFRPCLPLFAASKKRGIPCVGTIFDVYSTGKYYGLENWISFYGSFGLLGWITEQSILKLPFTHVITNSNATKIKIAKYFPSTHIDVVKCGVDVQRYPASLPKKVPGMILYLGRLVPYKNLQDLIHAVGIVNQQRRDTTLVIAGSGPLASYVQRIASSKNHISFHEKPSDSEKIKLLRAAQVLVLPSSEEGFGIVLLEANAAYTPIVCYDIPALRELVSSTGGGLTAEYRNVNDLADKILMIIERKELANHLALSGRRMVENDFSWPHAAHEVEMIYRKVISSS